MRSAVGVPPGSFVITGLSSIAATLRSCVVLPEPSMPSNVMNMSVQSVADAAKVVLPHQPLNNSVPRHLPQPLPPLRAPGQPYQLVVAGGRSFVVHAEEVPELGVLAVEDRAGLADRVLPPRERLDAHRMVMPGHRLRVVADLQAEGIETVGD